MIINYRKVHKDAIVPDRGTPHSVGYDMRAIGCYRVYPGRQVTIMTGLEIAIDYGFFGMVCDRSSVAINYGLIVGACIIDPDYRGEIMVNLFNPGDATIDLYPGQKVAQLIILPFITAKWTEVESLGSTVRGRGAIGSTGKF